MGDNDMTVKELIEKIVLPKLNSIEEKVDKQREYMDETFVRKETVKAERQQSDRVWTRRGVLATIFGVSSGLIWGVVSSVLSHPK